MAFQIPENTKISVTSSFPIKQLISKDLNQVKRVGFIPVTQVAYAKKKYISCFNRMKQQCLQESLFNKDTSFLI
jgi:peptidase E